MRDTTGVQGAMSAAFCTSFTILPVDAEFAGFGKLFCQVCGTEVDCADVTAAEPLWRLASQLLAQHHASLHPLHLPHNHRHPLTTITIKLTKEVRKRGAASIVSCLIRQLPLPRIAKVSTAVCQPSVLL